MVMEIENITPESNGFQALKSESISLGLNMLSRLEDNWLSKQNGFDKPGEKLSGTSLNGVLVGICGLNYAPFTLQTRIGRLRHLCVGTKWRRMHIGSLLLREELKDSDRWFDFINTNAPPSAFPFYERAGFCPLTNADRVTHRFAFRTSYGSN